MGPVEISWIQKKLFTVLHGLRALFLPFRPRTKSSKRNWLVCVFPCLPLSGWSQRFFLFTPGEIIQLEFLSYFSHGWNPRKSIPSNLSMKNTKTRPVSSICCVSGNRSWALWSSLVPWLEHALDHGLYWRLAIETARCPPTWPWWNLFGF